MTKFGRVTAFDASSGMATIVYERPQACEKCGACSGRGYTGTLVIQAHCAVGDWVRVELPDGRFLGASALAYVLPLCGLLAGLGLGWALSGGGDLGALAGAAAGLGLGALGLRAADRRIRQNPAWQPRVAAVYPTKPDQDLIGCGGQKP